MKRRQAMGTIGATVATAGTGIFGASPLYAQDTATPDVVEMVLGSPDAKVTLTEYASFTCPHCASFHNNVMGQLKANYVDTGKVKFVYRDVYFDRPGLWASLVARCDPNRFFGISDLLYKQQKDWVGAGNPNEIVQNLRGIGNVAGLSDEQLDHCLSDAETAQTLYTWFQANVEADDVQGTPTLFINDTKHSNMNYTDLSALLDEALAAE